MTRQLPAEAANTGQATTMNKLMGALACDFSVSEDTCKDPFTIQLQSREPRISPGWCDISVIRPGLFVTSADIRHGAAVERRHGGSELLKLHFCISGGSHIGGDHGEVSDVASASLVCFTQPLDSEKCETVAANVHEKSVTLACTRDFISDLADNCSLSLPEHLTDFARGAPSPFLCEQMPLPQPIRLLAEDLMNVRSSPFANLLREARSLELLSMALAHIAEASAAPPLRDRDHDRVRQIREIIEQEEGQLHSIKELSRLSAWNETQMMDCFKRITGSTISGYRQKHRMQKAISRLRESDVSITELAFDLGYEHPGNFATAFKKAFGFSPKDARSARHL